MPGMVPLVVTSTQYTSGDTDFVLTVEYTKLGRLQLGVATLRSGRQQQRERASDMMP